MSTDLPVPRTRPTSAVELHPNLDLARGLRLPRRGDQVARVLLVVGLTLYLALVGVLWRTGVLVPGAGQPPQTGVPGTERWPLQALALVSIALTLGAFGWSFVKDLRWLQNEEQDIAHLDGSFGTSVSDLDDHRRRVESVLSDRTVTTRRSVETLLDDRVAAVLGHSFGGQRRAGTEAELRAIAVARAAGVGSCARYVSGLLLLLTVLGTFIGIKSALPELTAALGTMSSTTAGPAVTLARMNGALTSVGSAFGANLGALLGSIALGVASFGLIAGRQSTLARLEQVSSLYVYPLAASRSKDTGLTDAVTALVTATQQFGGIGTQLVSASQSFGGIGTQLTSFGNTLKTFGDTIDSLSESVSDSLGTTTRTIELLLKQQGAQVADQGRQIADRLERQITDTAVAVQQATAFYKTIAGTLVDRAEALDNVAAAVGQATEELRLTREQFGIYADTATQTLDRRLGRLQEGLDQQLSLYNRIEIGVTRLADRAGELAGAVQSAELQRQDADARQRAALFEMDARQQAMLAEMDVRQHAWLREIEARVTEALRNAEFHQREADARQQAALLEIDGRIAESVAARLEVAAGDLSTTLGQLPDAVYAGTTTGFERVARDLARLIPSAAAPVAPAPPSISPRLLRQLADTLGRLDAHLARPSLASRVGSRVGRWLPERLRPGRAAPDRAPVAQPAPLEAGPVKRVHGEKVVPTQATVGDRPVTEGDGAASSPLQWPNVVGGSLTAADNGAPVGPLAPAAAPIETDDGR